MFQMTRVFPRTRAFDNLLTAGPGPGPREPESTRRADALIEELTLGPVRHLDAGQLSGGQRKLLEFGMCFDRAAAGGDARRAVRRRAPGDARNRWRASSAAPAQGATSCS